MQRPIYKRVVLKLSGEALAGEKGFGLAPNILDYVASQIKGIHDLGVEVAIVVGGGNFWRGRLGEEMGLDRASADYIGMLATVMNAIALQDAIEKYGMDTRVMAAIEMRQVAEPFIRRRAIRHLEKGRIVIFAAGNGSPYFTTDTTSALRAAEIEAEVILMGKQGVQGIYDSDPRINKDAVKYTEVSYQEVLAKGLKVMDTTAIALCMDNRIPIIVYDVMGQDYAIKVLVGENVGQTLVRGEKS